MDHDDDLGPGPRRPRRPPPSRLLDADREGETRKGCRIPAAPRLAAEAARDEFSIAGASA